MSGKGKGWLKKVRKIIIEAVNVTSKKLLLKPKFDDEKIVGIIIKIENGLVIPPER